MQYTSIDNLASSIQKTDVLRFLHTTNRTWTCTITLKSRDGAGIKDPRTLNGAISNPSFSDSCFPICAFLSYFQDKEWRGRGVPADRSRLTKLNVYCP